MKNRTLFFLLLALCPLAFLTAASLVDFFCVPPRSAPDDRELLMDLSAKSVQRQEMLKTSKALQEGLGEVHLILPIDLAESKFNQNTQLYGIHAEDLAYIRGWNAVLGNLSDTLYPLRRITADSLANTENVTLETLEEAQGASESIRKAYGRFSRYGKETVSSLNDVREKNPDTALGTNAENYGLKLTEMMGLVQERVERSREIHKMKKSFLEALEHFEEKNFQECYRICRKILTNKLLDETFKPEVLEKNFQARSLMALEELAKIADSTDSLERKIEKIEELNEKVRTAGKGLEKDLMSELGSEYMEKMSVMLLQYIEENSLKKIQYLTEDLEKDSSLTFSEKLEDIGEVIEKIDAMNKQISKSTDLTESPKTDELKEELRRILTQHLDSCLPKAAESDEKIQEAELTDGRIVTGYFRLVKEDGKEAGYRIYSSVEEFENQTSSKGMTPIDEFLSLPGPSLEARSITQYVDAREELMKDLKNRTAWNEFLGICEGIDKDLEKWSEKSQVKATFSVKKPIAIAKGTLKKGNWSIMEAVFH